VSCCLLFSTPDPPVIIVRGKKTLYMMRPWLETLMAQYDGVTIDLGAGDGWFTYRTALAKPQRLVIAVEPVRENIVESSARRQRTRSTGGPERRSTSPHAWSRCRASSNVSLTRSS